MENIFFVSMAGLTPKQERRARMTAALVARLHSEGVERSALMLEAQRWVSPDVASELVEHTLASD